MILPASTHHMSYSWRSASAWGRENLLGDPVLPLPGQAPPPAASVSPPASPSSQGILPTCPLPRAHGPQAHRPTGSQAIALSHSGPLSSQARPVAVALGRNLFSVLTGRSGQRAGQQGSAPFLGALEHCSAHQGGHRRDEGQGGGTQQSSRGRGRGKPSSSPPSPGPALASRPGSCGAPAAALGAHRQPASPIPHPLRGTVTGTQQALGHGWRTWSGRSTHLSGFPTAPKGSASHARSPPSLGSVAHGPPVWLTPRKRSVSAPQPHRGMNRSRDKADVKLGPLVTLDGDRPLYPHVPAACCCALT